MGYRRGLALVPSLPQPADEIREHLDAWRAVRRATINAEEGLLSPLELQSFVFAEATRMLGDGPGEAA